MKKIIFLLIFLVLGGWAVTKKASACQGYYYPSFSYSYGYYYPPVYYYPYYYSPYSSGFRANISFHRYPKFYRPHFRHHRRPYFYKYRNF